MKERLNDAQIIKGGAYVIRLCDRVTCKELGEKMRAHARTHILPRHRAPRQWFTVSSSSCFSFWTRPCSSSESSTCHLQTTRRRPKHHHSTQKPASSQINSARALVVQEALATGIRRLKTLQLCKRRPWLAQGG